MIRRVPGSHLSSLESRTFSACHSALLGQCSCVSVQCPELGQSGARSREHSIPFPAWLWKTLDVKSLMPRTEMALC